MVASNQNAEGGILSQLKSYKARGIAKSYVVLDNKNDPFWVLPSRERNAQWIAGIWEKYGGTSRWPGYDRGIHYFILGLGLECPWGQNRRVHPNTQYMNVLSDWGTLCRAIKDARNWGLIPWDAIECKQSAGLESWIDYGRRTQKLPFEDLNGKVDHYLSVTIPEVEGIETASIFEDSFDEEVDDLIDDLFDRYVKDLSPTRYQPYHVAIVSEKSGLEKIVRRAHVVDEDDDWLFDSSRNPTLQAKLLKEYKP